MQRLPGILLIPTPQQYTGRREGLERSKQKWGTRDGEDGGRKDRLGEEWSAACRIKGCLPGEETKEREREKKREVPKSDSSERVLRVSQEWQKTGDKCQWLTHKTNQCIFILEALGELFLGADTHFIGQSNLQLWAKKTGHKRCQYKDFFFK